MPLISRKVSATESTSSHSSLRKTPNEGTTLGKRKNTTNSLNPASSEIGWSGFSSVAKKSCLRKTKKSCSSRANSEDVSDSCIDLRLAFSSIDGNPSDQKASINTFFCPVFSLYKDLDGDVSNTDSNTSEITQDEEQRHSDANHSLDCCSVDQKFSDDNEEHECCSEDQTSECCSLEQTCSNNIPSLESCSVDKDDFCSTRALSSTHETDLDTAVMPLDAAIETSSDLESNDFEKKEKSVTISDDICPQEELELVSTVSNTIDDDVFGVQAAFSVHTDCTGWLYEDGTRDPVGTVEDEYMNSEGASLYLAVQQSKVLDYPSNNAITQVENTTVDEIENFDPYLFIKHLPDLSEVVSFRPPILLPKETCCSPPITLVLDLDETLVHSTLEHSEDADFTFPVTCNSQDYTVYVKCRPHLKTFMDRVSQMFEIIVFTASQSIYAEQLLDILDPERKWIQHRVFRDSCVLVNGNYLKDLTILGRDLSKVAIIDNSPQAFGFQVDNGIPVESWFDDKSDAALTRLLPFLETLVGADDVRPLIANQFNLRQKIAVAMQHPCQNILGRCTEEV